MLKSRLAAALFCSVSLFCAHSAMAENAFPDRTVTLVVPFSPGGGHDFVARMIASKLGSELHQSVIVLNKPGADAMIGAQYVAQSPPDGYTVLIGSPAENVAAPFIYKHMQYDPATALAPVTLAGESPIALIANPAAPVSTMEELIAYAKKNPGKLSYATPGIGSSHDLAIRWIEELAGIKLQDIPYKGASDATVSAVGGQTPLASVGMAPVMPLWKDGKVKVIAIMNSKKPDWLPNVATASQVPELSQVDIEQWMGVFVPAKTPADRIAKLNSAIVAVLKRQDVRTALINQGVDPVGNSTSDFTAFLANERIKYASIVQKSKIPMR